MEKKIIIFGSSKDSAKMQELEKALAPSGIEADIIFSEIAEDLKEIDDSNSVVFLINNQTGDRSFELIHQSQTSLGLQGINFFSEPVGLTQNQRNLIGRNKSVFLDLNPSDYIQDLVTLLKEEDTHPINQETTSTQTVQKKSSEGNSHLNIPEIPVANSETSNFVSSPSSSNDSTNDEKEGDSEEKAPEKVSPWTAIFIMIGAVIGAVILLRLIRPDLGSFFGYVILALPIYYDFITLRKLNEWRKLNGMDFRVGLAFVVGILTMLISVGLMLFWFISPYY